MTANTPKLDSDHAIAELRSSLKALSEKEQVVALLEESIESEQLKVTQMTGLYEEMQVMQKTYSRYLWMWLGRHGMAGLINMVLYLLIVLTIGRASSDIIFNILIGLNFVLIGSIPLSRAIAAVTEIKLSKIKQDFYNISQEFDDIRDA